MTEMSAARQQSELLKKINRERLRGQIIEVRLVDCDPDYPDPDTVWRFRPLTAQEKERVVQLFQERKVVEAEIEQILARAVDENGKRFFPQAMKSELWQWPHDFLDAVSLKIGATEKDFFGDTSEDPEGN